MITGTIYNAGKMLVMTQKWEQKKSYGNILKKEVKELSPEEQQLKMYQEQLEREREEQLVGGADENSEVNAESDNETQVVPNISEDDNIVDNAGNTMKDTQHSVALETEKKVLEEMFELEKDHFGESKKAVKIDVSL